MNVFETWNNWLQQIKEEDQKELREKVGNLNRMLSASSIYSLQCCRDHCNCPV